MATYRVHKTKDFTVMSNAHLRDKNMTLKAKGLLSVMLSLPDDWDYSINGFVAISKENETAIKSALSELKSLGYLVVTKLKPSETASGRYEYLYDVYELPQEKPAVEKQAVEKQGVENLSVENPTQLNTKELNTKELNTKKSNTEIYISEFSELWALYPNKKGKEKALSAYIKAREDGTEKETVLKGITDYAKECELKGRAKEYIKHGSTWFNQKGWEDEYDLTPAIFYKKAAQPYKRADDVDLDGIL